MQLQLGVLYSDLLLGWCSSFLVRCRLANRYHALRWLGMQ